MLNTSILLTKIMTRLSVGFHERPPGPFWLFAYGSLIWRPDIPVAEEILGRAEGWHRAFCMRMTRWRATREQPGLMLALDRGEECIGVLYRIAEEDLKDALAALLRREITAKPPSNQPTWIDVESAGETHPALAFVMNRDGDDYVTGLSPDEVAREIARACGHLGSNAEYPRNTVSHLEARGVHDPYLWHLQELVARILAASEFGRADPGLSQ